MPHSWTRENLILSLSFLGGSGTKPQTSSFFPLIVRGTYYNYLNVVGLIHSQFPKGFDAPGTDAFTSIIL